MPIEEVYEIKINELVGIADDRVLGMWAIVCVERVLEVFENAYPNDNRPREVLEAARDCLDGKISVNKLKAMSMTAHSVGHQVKDVQASNVAHASGYAASSIDVPGHALYAANFVAKVDPQIREWQYDQLMRFVMTTRI